MYALCMYVCMYVRMYVYSNKVGHNNHTYFVVTKVQNSTGCS